jgi:hypothetical protein
MAVFEVISAQNIPQATDVELNDLLGPVLRSGAPVMVPLPVLKGKSTYELAVQEGYTGTIEEWLQTQQAEANAANEAAGEALLYLTEMRKDKGHYISSEALIAAVPNPLPGDYAFVGVPYPGTVYRPVAGVWTDTEEIPDNVLATAADAALTAAATASAAAAEVNGAAESVADFVGIVELSQSKNLLNKDQIVSGSYYSPSTKLLTSSALWRRSGYIPVTEGATYCTSGRNRNDGGYFVEFGDTEAVANISVSGVTGGHRFTVPTGQGIKYVVLNIDSTGSDAFNDTAQMELGSAVTSYVAFEIFKKINSANFPDLSTVEITENETLPPAASRVHSFALSKEEYTVPVPGKNLVDKSKIVSGSQYSPSLVRINASALWRRTDYIEVTEGATYCTSGRNRNDGGYFAEYGDTNAIQSITGVAGVTGGHRFTVPTGLGIKYMILNIDSTGSSAFNDTAQAEAGEAVTEYEAYSETRNNA